MPIRGEAHHARGGVKVMGEGGRIQGGGSRWRMLRVERRRDMPLIHAWDLIVHLGGAHPEKWPSSSTSGTSMAILEYLMIHIDP